LPACDYKLHARRLFLFFHSWFSLFIVIIVKEEKMKSATLIGILLGLPLAILAIMASAHLPGLGERALTDIVAQLPTPTTTEPTTFFIPALPESCSLPPIDSPSRVTIGREGRDGRFVGCALDAFRELFPGCGDPTTNPEDFSLELFKAWLAANGYEVDKLPDANGDGIPDPIVYPNQVFTGFWENGVWSGE
jgi:hypothetical protein